VLGKLGKQNRIDLTRNCELHELAKWHHLPVARSSAILFAHFLHVPYKDNLRHQTDNPNFLGHLWHKAGRLHGIGALFCISSPRFLTKHSYMVRQFD